jgi:hypothetical protein
MSTKVVEGDFFKVTSEHIENVDDNESQIIIRFYDRNNRQKEVIVYRIKIQDGGEIKITPPKW